MFFVRQRSESVPTRFGAVWSGATAIFTLVLPLCPDDVIRCLVTSLDVGRVLYNDRTRVRANSRERPERTSPQL